MFPGVLSLCRGGSGVRLLPADVFLHHRSVHRHPPHGGELQIIVIIIIIIIIN